LIGSFSKMLEFIRYRKDYCLFVNIFEKALKELLPFIISFFIFVIIFSIIIILMQGSLDLEDDDEYRGVPFFFKTFI
jgi:hypothetical protein